LAAPVTLSQLQNTILQRINQEQAVNQGIVTAAELLQNINDSGSEFNDQLSAAFGSYYRTTRAYFYVANGQEIYPFEYVLTLSSVSGLTVGQTITGETSGATGIIYAINGSTISLATLSFTPNQTGSGFVQGEHLNSGGGPTVASLNGGLGIPNFMQLHGIDVQTSGQRWISIREFALAERDYFQLPSYNMTVFGPLFAYRFEGANMVFAPIPSGAYQMRMFFTPTWTPLVNGTDVVDSIDGWLELVVLDVCIKLQAKFDYTVEPYMTQKTAMLKRIEDLKQQRDTAQPPRIKDTSNDALNEFMNTYGRIFGV
jgi:hypothetical protein